MLVLMKAESGFEMVASQIDCNVILPNIINSTSISSTQTPIYIDVNNHFKGSAICLGAYCYLREVMIRKYVEMIDKSILRTSSLTLRLYDTEIMSRYLPTHKTAQE